MAMTPTSDNGWSVVGPEDVHGLLTTLHVGGRSFRVRKSQAKEWTALLLFLNKIEPFTEAGWDGGYAYRLVRGALFNASCHASGTAIDHNASQHPRGRRKTYSLAKRIKIRAWLAVGVGRCFTWGADFRTTVDEMHFQMKPESVWAKYRIRTPKSAPKSVQIKGVQGAIGMPTSERDGVLGPKTQAALKAARTKCQADKKANRTMIVNVQKSIGCVPLTVPGWGPRTDARLRTLGFRF